MQVDVWYFEECPNWRTGADRLRLALGRAGLGHAEVRLVPVASEADAVSVGFAGSPTFTLDGVDLFDPPPSTGGLTCRVYRTSTGLAGVPDVDDLVAALSGKANR